MPDAVELKHLYDGRFGGQERARAEIWVALCSGFFQRWVDPSATVLEVAAGRCEFINAIHARRKIAVDLNPDVGQFAADGVEAHVCSSTEMTGVADGEADVVFVSNFFEHLSKSDILATLREIRRVLRPGGRLLVLQPNIRYCRRDYWMFFDHITALDHHALAEALELTGFAVEHTVVRFLPFTTKGRLPTAVWLVRAYLRFPLAWRVLGQQTFMVARPTA